MRNPPDLWWSSRPRQSRAVRRAARHAAFLRGANRFGESGRCCPYGVAVNALCPNKLNTIIAKEHSQLRLFRQGLVSPSCEDIGDRCLPNSGMPCAERRDVSAAVLCLTSHGTRYVTDDVLPVSAGMISSNIE